MPIIKLISSDEQILDVDVDVANCSVLIKTMLEDLGLDEGETTVPVPMVHSAILQKVIEWCTQHKDDPPLPEDDKNKTITTDICEWDADFLKKISQGTLFGLMEAANYLDIKGLLYVTCQSVANVMILNSPEDICKIYNIVNDLPGPSK